MLVLDPARLPERVREMREAILAAARTGRIEAMRGPLEWNELKPEVADNQPADPIAHWRAVSGDGEGREVLAALIGVLETPAAVLEPGGRGERYVWPAFAEMALDMLEPPAEVALYRLVSPAEAKAMREARRWTSWRLVIGKDGTWHSFRKGI
jgi:hypothetical protein